ncbi:hypothetical protein D3C86_1559100 [compost metagenome]
MLEALVVVVHRYRQNLLGLLLPDHILIQAFADFVGRGQVRARGGCGVLVGRGGLVTDDFIAQVDAFVANEHRRACDELLDLVLALAAERAIQKLLAG